MKAKNMRSKIGSVIFKGFCWAYAAFSLFPIVWMIFFSLKNNSEIFVTNPFGFPTTLRWENYEKAWSQYDVPTYFFNSFFVATLTSLFVVVLAALFAYAVARLKWPGRRIAQVYMSFGMFVPVQAILIPVARIVNDMGLGTSRFGLISVYTAINLSFASLVYYGFLRGIPKELEEAACIDGANIFTCFTHVITPLLAPATATLVIYAFLNSWNEFILANVLIQQDSLRTLPLGLLFL
ncbi:MAG: carbohydrate ABC transporter permease, partial [Oscillospiraceae bacterium]|nr:carbohydrate ABC transporter permease [Oscillospiraceae bacterium]